MRKDEMRRLVQSLTEYELVDLRQVLREEMEARDQLHEAPARMVDFKTGKPLMRWEPEKPGHAAGRLVPIGAEQ